ncbi:alpha-N-acetylgalactosaminidase [Paenibacillus baekrokdamisoli]|uniref:Alpha-N-acetylgalactosaminidase n=1 Tax=Paenibacillus baekrokdamisoli TaxID=1712516 RepID=A0A3G9J1F8_9BACL|nr:Gfo/Idh/MocA family oxidoreductase [Paenibacillus baekrokdamisoli]MBB3071368.1 putative dehydrogenase [Paenibacillus baekrokdamisoli]BBH24596.1 alpha-N-acetylgalactosaminidase [Paenibacillus baekrokdamisoli]
MTIKVGIVGARGLSTIRGFQSSPEAEVVAICDLDESLLAEASKQFNIPRTYRIFEDMLESDIDAVVIATPMQLHTPQTLAALEAGKHVLSEVTAGVTMDELWWLKENVEKHNQVYMMAENYCYIPENQLINNMVEQGLFGEVYFGEGEYIHDLKSLTVGYNRPSSNNQKTSWRKYWQTGKRGAFYPTHSLGPVMKWFKGDRIESVSCFGTGWHTSPEHKQEDTSITLCRLASGKLIKIRIDCISNRPHNMSYYSLQGTKGCYEAPRGLGDQHKICLTAGQNDKDNLQWQPLKDFYHLLPERYLNATEEQRESGHWGGDYFIIQDFIDAITKNVQPSINVYDACEWTAVAFLSELSAMNGGKAIPMPNFRTSSSFKDQIINLS